MNIHAVEQRISQMTLEDKAALCTGTTPWTTLAVERAGIDSIVVSDGPHGLRHATNLEDMITDSLPATCFPVAAALSASWDVELLEEMGQALADESIAVGTDIILGPGMNIKRSPLCGRNFEYFSEDPFLSGELASALVNGIQSKGVGACVKHFAVNNQETRRFTLDAVIDERTLHEIYLAGFENVVRNAHPWTVMCAYNSVNGQFCAENSYLLTEILRNQWGFEGFVVSDWGAVHDRVEGIRAGLELEMPGPSPHRTQDVIKAVQSGELGESVLNQAVERLLKIILRAKETPKGHSQIDIPAHHALARHIASECMVLVKNIDNTLPLRGHEQLAVIGVAAKNPVYQGGGSSHINATRVDTPLDFLRERTEIRYIEGDASVEMDQRAIDESIALAQDADVVVLFLALPASIESEGYDRKHLNLTEQQTALIKAVTTVVKRTVVVLNNGSAIAMDAWINDVDAVLEAWLPGQAGAGAIVDILYGDINPSGKLAETFPITLQDTPSYLSFPGERNEVRYGEGIFVGYRGYEMQNRQVLFPFGFGLSYTQFEYSNLSVSATEFSTDETVSVTVDISNVGTRMGKEIVQLYVHDPASTLPRPPKELKAFKKVALTPNETKTITFTLNDRAFSYYDPAYGQWVAERGEFDILIGASSADIRLSQRITLVTGTPVPSILNEHSTLSEWIEDPRGAELIQSLFSSMFGDMESDALGINLGEFFKDLPLRVLLSFVGNMTDTQPEDSIREMLERLEQ